MHTSTVAQRFHFSLAFPASLPRTLPLPQTAHCCQAGVHIPGAELGDHIEEKWERWWSGPPSAPLYISLLISVLWQQENSVQPGKRPLSFLLPTVVRPAEGLCGTYLALGANGAARGLSGLTQVRATPLWIFCSREPCCDLVCHDPHIVSPAFPAITGCTALCQAYPGHGCTVLGFIIKMGP